MNKIEIGGLNLSIPNDFQRLESMPEDPKDSLVYGMQNEGTTCYVLLYPVDPKEAMPFDIGQISKGIHAKLGEKQGLIDIRTCQTGDGLKSVYSIVKTMREPSGVQYNLTLQIVYPDQILHVQGYFEETGITGQRDSSVYESSVKENLVKRGALKDGLRIRLIKNIKTGY